MGKKTSRIPQSAQFNMASSDIKFFTQVYKVTQVSNFLKKEVKYGTKKSSTKKNHLTKTITSTVISPPLNIIYQ